MWRLRLAGQPLVRHENSHGVVVSECPLAPDHIVQGMEKLSDDGKAPELAAVHHPIQVLAKATVWRPNMNPKTNITHADILEMADYEAIRNERRREIAGIKKTAACLSAPAPFISNVLTPCGTRFTRCCASRKAVRSRFRTR